ncbi:hypothetical protein [Bacillus sp. MUM 13]|uniref:hypothetical protein n=1 Tax=Bacillus sp. MUM 13 TaxID=1678001 RepID=UPI0008F5F49E|nr:hypothetical protein [Bacillus sp. MUM 13]OIK09585.1 hypothetical protein BIV59_16605 [Bacillus sp. MUM 13]
MKIVNTENEVKRRMNLKTKNALMILSIALFILSGCSSNIKEETNPVKDNPKNSVFNLDRDSIKDLQNGALRGTPLKLDKTLKLSDIEKDWGKPDEHRDLEERQLYRYTIKNQTFYIYVDEMNVINNIQVELNDSKSEILKVMGEPSKPGHIFIYEKKNHVIQFEKFDKWRLILRTK